MSRLPIPIAVVLSSFEAGGTERQMTELIRRLDPRRFTVHVICFRRTGQLLPRVEEAAVNLAEFRLSSFKSPTSLGQMWRCARWLRERGVQVLHACDLYANVFALPAAALAGVPVRIGSRRELAPPDKTGAHLAAQRLAYLLAHRVVANSQAAGARLVEEGVPDWRVAHIANGIDLEPFTPAPARARRRVVATVANLRQEKGHDVLLRAAAQVLRQVPDVTFRIIGGGPMREALEAQAAALGITGGVEFLGHREDVPALLHGSDLYAFPSRTEAFPNGLIEGMAAGLPCVASAVGGILELIEHERNGLLVPAGNADALASALLSLIDRQEVATALGAAARRTIEAQYSFERMVGEFESLYVSELELRAAPAIHAAAAPAFMSQPPKQKVS